MPRNKADCDKCPKRFIVTDDPLRARMMAAHHLDHASLLYERGDAQAWSGSYDGAQITLLSTGPDLRSALIEPECAGLSGTGEMLYVGVCASASSGVALWSIVLPGGGDPSMRERCVRAAARLNLPIHPHPAETDISDGMAAAFHACARDNGIAALSVLTVAENTATGEKMEEHERRSRLYGAVRLAFETLACHDGGDS